MQLSFYTTWTWKAVNTGGRSELKKFFNVQSATKEARMGKSLFTKWCGQSWTVTCKSMKLEQPLSQTQTQTQNGLKTNIRHDTYKTPRREYSQNILWHQSYQCFLRSFSQGNKNKNENKQMVPKKTHKLLHSKRNHKQNEKTT